MTNKTYKHFIDGVHVATYKQPSLRRYFIIKQIKEVLGTIVSVTLIVAVAYVALLVL